MSEIAAEAGISIGSLYQYFPDKSAVIRALAEARHAQTRRCVEDALADVDDPERLCAAFENLFDRYYRMTLSEPAMRDIAAAMQTDRSLAALELAESRLCGSMLAAAIRRAGCGGAPTETDTSAFLIWQLGESAIRLAVSLGRAEGDALVDAFKRMAIKEIAAPDGRRGRAPARREAPQ
jgi:AcrR family transcriptional regulator